jgi:hypothetical protein
MSNNLAKHSHELSSQQREIYAPGPTHHFGRPGISDVSLHLYNTFYWGHRLQVDCNNERKVPFPSSTTHQKQGEQKAIRYPQPNQLHTNREWHIWHIYLLAIRGLFCWYIQVAAQNLQVPIANQATRQTNFGTDGLLGTGTRIPGSSFQEQHTDQPHASLLISPPKKVFFISSLLFVHGAR